MRRWVWKQGHGAPAPEIGQQCLATSQRDKVTLWMQDTDCREKEGVNYWPARAMKV